MFSIDAIVDALDQHHHRATYGAVAELLGRPSRSLMSECPKNRRCPWVVSQKHGMPSGYSSFQRHPSFMENEDILSTRGELVEWLRSHRSQS